MQTPLNPKRSPLKAWVLGVAMAVVLTACGGGGGGGSSTTSGGSGGGGGGGGGSSSAPVTLTGVAAIGAPLIGATVSVLDSNGADCGSGTTALSDGKYTLTLTCTSPALPLLVQVVGVDMAGVPVLLHTVLQTVVSGAGTQMYAHVNPVTNAVVALLLGRDPGPSFLAGKASTSGSATVRTAQWGLLGNSAAYTAASTFIKTIIQSNLNTVDLNNTPLSSFFSDSTFSANKKGLDAVIESLNIQFRQDNSTNPITELMLMGNRLLPPCDPSNTCAASPSSRMGSPEVIVNLTSASARLNTSTPSVSATSDITTTVKTTTSTASLMRTISDLDLIRSVLNANLTPINTAMNLASLDYVKGSPAVNKPVFSASFGTYDGGNALAVAGQLAAYGASNYQLSSFMIQGCLDYPITALCTKIKVAALVRDSGGTVHGVFEGVANYISATSSWALTGNGRSTPWAIHPATWLYLNGQGTEVTSTGAPLRQGIQAIVKGLDSVTPVFADVIAPSGSVAHFYACEAATYASLCLNANSNVGYETGDLVLDQVLPTTGTSLLGATDARPGTRFQMTATNVGGQETTSGILMADLPSSANQAVYPRPDSFYVGGSLLQADITGGMTLSWDTWAAANPGMRVMEVRTVISRPAPNSPSKQVFTIQPLSANQLVIPAFSSVPSDATEYALWMIALDTQGRRYMTKIAVSP